MATGLWCAHAHHTTTHFHIFSEIFHLFFLNPHLRPPHGERGEVRQSELVKFLHFDKLSVTFCILCHADRVEAW